MPFGEQILIAESDPDIADLIGRQSLQPLGYQVKVVGDAASAIKFAIQSPPQFNPCQFEFSRSKRERHDHRVNCAGRNHPHHRDR
jgi:CheY-like chemotaxis protein